MTYSGTVHRRLPDELDSVISDERRARASRSGQTWFREHFEEAASQVIDFISADGIELEGKSVADVGCGDGIIGLGVAMAAKPARLVGFDLKATRRDELERMASMHAGIEELPASLEFRRSKATAIPADNGEFDVVFSWSAFEHVEDPVSLLREVRRILKPSGVLMIQIWPFFHSEHGSHLHEWFPDGFAPSRFSPDEIIERVHADLADDPDWAEERIEEFRTLNRISLDELGRALLAADFFVAKLEVLGGTVHLDRDLARYPLSKLGVGGVKLLAGHL